MGKESAMEALGTARLSDEIAADRAVTATISRGEIDGVLREADGTPELVLRLADEGGAEQGRISMTWSRDDLERLLAAATGDGVVLTFDRDQLAAAFADVEAHGLRTRAAIFAVAAAGALGTGAGAAYAQIPGGGDGGTTPIAAAADSTVTDASTGGYAAAATAGVVDTTVTDASTGGYATDDATAAAALQARSQGLNEQYGLGGSGADSALAARSQALNEEYGLGSGTAADAAAALGARSQAMNEQYGLQGGSSTDAATRALEARGAAMNEAYGLGSAGSDAIVTDASTGGGYAGVPNASSGTFDIQRPADEAALVVGGVLLTLAGAAFAVRRTASPRPA
jgi:hypothetical protein